MTTPLFLAPLTSSLAYHDRNGSGTMTSDGPVRYVVDSVTLPTAVLDAPDVMTSPPTLTLNGPGGSSVIAGSSLVAYNDARIRTFAGTVAPIAAYGAGINAYAPSGIDSTFSTPPYAVDCVIDADRFEIVGKGNGGTVHIKIDGEYVTQAPTSMGANNGSRYRLLVDFGTAASRRVVMTFFSNVYFEGVTIPASGSVSLSDADLGPSVGVLGDSYTEGTGEGGQDSYAGVYGGGFAQRLRDYTGWDDVHALGSGGTGYLNPGSNTRKTLRQRIYTDAVLKDFDIVIIPMGINDQGRQTEAALNAEVDALLERIRLQLPHALLLVVGPWWPTGSPVQGVLDVRDGVSDSAATWAHAFFDPIVSTTTSDTNVGVITGTGKTSAKNGSGNADFFISADGTHPTSAGHDYLALWLAGEIVGVAAAVDAMPGGVVIEEATENLVPNPIFGNGTTTWEIYNGGNGATYTSGLDTTAGRFKTGTQSLKIDVTVNPASGTPQLVGVQIGGGFVTGNYPHVTAGDHYTTSFDVEGYGLTVQVQMTWFNAGGTAISSSSGPRVRAESGWIGLSAVAPATAVSVKPVLAIYPTVAGDIGRVWIDAVQTENTAHQTSLAYGSAGSGYDWTGTAHASSSTRDAAALHATTATPTATVAHYSDDDGLTREFAYLEPDGAVGATGDVDYDGTDLNVTTTRRVMIGSLATYDRELSATQQARLEAAMPIRWQTIDGPPVLVSALRIPAVLTQTRR